MIKCIVGRTFKEIADEATRENGGIPYTDEFGFTWTEENLEERLEHIAKIYGEAVKEMQEEYILDRSNKTSNC